MTTATEGQQIVHVPVADIVPGPVSVQRSRTGRYLEDLGATISELGVRQAIKVRPKLPSRNGAPYELITGRLRLEAARLVGEKTIPAIPCDLTDKEATIEFVIENCYQWHLRPLEEAELARRLVEEYDCDLRTAAEYFGRTKQYLKSRLKLLTLPESVQAWMATERLSLGHARLLLKLETKKEQEAMAKKTVREDLTVAQLRDLLSPEPDHYPQELNHTVQLLIGKLQGIPPDVTLPPEWKRTLRQQTELLSGCLTEFRRLLDTA